MRRIFLKCGAKAYFLDEKIMLISAVVKIITPIRIKISSIPMPILGSLSKKSSGLKNISCSFAAARKFIKFIIIYLPYFANMLRMIPPAITEAICPETLTPIECIRRKF